MYVSINTMHEVISVVYLVVSGANTFCVYAYQVAAYFSVQCVSTCVMDVPVCHLSIIVSSMNSHVVYIMCLHAMPVLCMHPGCGTMLCVLCIFMYLIVCGCVLLCFYCSQGGNVQSETAPSSWGAEEGRLECFSQSFEK